MIKLALAAARQKLRGFLNPVIGEQIWVVNREAVLAKAHERWKQMSKDEKDKSDFQGFGDSVLGRLTSAAQKLADKANAESAVIVDSPLVHRVTPPAPLTAEQADLGWRNKIWSGGGGDSSLEPAFYSSEHGFTAGGEFQHEPGSGGSGGPGGIDE